MILIWFALDAIQVTELWHFNTGVGIAAAPITYLVDKEQQITLVAGMNVLTFSLDENAVPRNSGPTLRQAMTLHKKVQSVFNNQP